MLSHFIPVWLFATLWTVVYQVPLSMGFSQQEYWSGPPFPPPGDRPNPGMEPTSLASPALADRFFTTSATWESLRQFHIKATVLFLFKANGPVIGYGLYVERSLTMDEIKPLKWGQLQQRDSWELASGNTSGN